MKQRILVISSIGLILALFGSGQVQTKAIQAISIAPLNTPYSLVFTFQVPPLQFTQTEDGSSTPSLEGYENGGAPGDPVLPAKPYLIALPPDVIPESVKAEVLSAQTTDLDETNQIEPAPPGKTWVEDKEMVLWGMNADSIVEGKNTQVYHNDAFFPQSQLSSVRFDQMRKWRFVSLLLRPLQYNPVTEKLRLTTEMQVQVTFERAPTVDQQQLRIELSDTVMDERAAELFYNYAEAQAWYPLMPKPAGLTTTYNYVIITSNSIVNSSKKLSSFIAHKQDQGYSVLVVTEGEYGGLTGQWPNRLAQKIRRWLIDNYLSMSIEYVLLIGDPTPYNPDNPNQTVGDVPTVMCWSMRRFLDKYGNPLGQNTPTDYQYANLTGNWFLNTHHDGDEYCGELTDDIGLGGVSFHPDVYVGRIPVYQNEPGSIHYLDDILAKTIVYEDSGDLTWRKRALLPMGFLDSITDGGYLAEAMKNTYLNAAGYDSHTLYQHTGDGCYSSFSSDQNLVKFAVRDHWKNRDYGLVTWLGHGGSDGTDIGYEDCNVGKLMSSSDSAYLDLGDDRPAIVFSASCSNGYPEDQNNLGYSLLQYGAIATITGFRNTYYIEGVFNTNEAGISQISYYVMQRIVNGETVGHALYDEKYQMSLNNIWDDLVANWIAYNLYGDPSLSINDGHIAPPGTPYNLTVSPFNGSMKLLWTDNSDNELGFVIERTTNPSIAWMQVHTVGINENSWSDSGLSCGSHYFYRVHAYNAYGGSSNSNQADAWILDLDDYETDNAYSDAKFITPAGSGASGQTHTFDHPGDIDWVKFNAAWGKIFSITTSNLGVSNDTVLELYDQTGSGLLATNDNCTSGSTASCINDWVAPPGGVFYIKINHKNGQGGCVGYNYDLAVKEGGVADWPAQPSNLTATPISHCQVNLSWISNSSTETGFEIQRYGWQDMGLGIGMIKWNTIAMVGAGVTNYHDTGLVCNTAYPYRVSAYNENGKSFFSNAANAVTFTADGFEADDSSSSARTITVNGSSQEHTFHTEGDQDWVKFSASAGQVYTITTSIVDSANDTVLELYDTNGETSLEWNDDCTSLAACIKKWAAPASGTYYVKVSNYHDKGGCPGYEYTLRVTGTSSGTTLARPSGIYASNPKVSSIQLTWPDPVSTPHAFEVERWEVYTSTLGQWRQIGVAGPGLIYRPEKTGSELPDDGYAGFSDSGLTCNTTYSYRIRASDSLGNSAFSEVIEATTSQWDTFEPDNDYTQAGFLYVNLPEQNHNLGPDIDYDWFQFTATAGEVYTITTSQFTHSDWNLLLMQLYDDPTGVPREGAQRCGEDTRSLCINGWSPSSSGTYYTPD